MAHVSLITLAVRDLDVSRAFYEALGWVASPASVEGTIVFLQGGTVVLALYIRDDFANEVGRPLADGTAPIALATNVASPAAVEQLLSTAARAGGRIVRSAARADWGGTSGYMADPDGHLWEVAHNPHFPLDEQGRITLPPA